MVSSRPSKERSVFDTDMTCLLIVDAPFYGLELASPTCRERVLTGDLAQDILGQLCHYAPGVVSEA